MLVMQCDELTHDRVFQRSRKICCGLGEVDPGHGPETEVGTDILPTVEHPFGYRSGFPERGEWNLGDHPGLRPSHQPSTKGMDS